MSHLLLAGSVHWGGFLWTGNFTSVDLVAASTNALNGALLAWRQFTIVGILLMAPGWAGGGIPRDVLVGQIPPRSRSRPTSRSRSPGEVATH